MADGLIDQRAAGRTLAFQLRPGSRRHPRVVQPGGRSGQDLQQVADPLQVERDGAFDHRLPVLGRYNLAGEHPDKFVRLPALTR